MVIKAVAFDFGHTLMDERKDGKVPSNLRPVHLMPEVSEVLPVLSLPLAVWANTRTATEVELRQWLERAGIGRFFAWVVTSVDAGFRKPAPEFFDFALAKGALSKDEVLFVGNQLNTDITGGEQYGIRTVWLSGRPYRSAEETLSPKDACPAFTIRTFRQLPLLLQRIRDPEFICESFVGGKKKRFFSRTSP